MGIFSGAKAQIDGRMAFRAHIAANELADGALPEAGRMLLIPRSR